ncbi:413_t:CDS:2, partial [Acaulospora colombiana]
ESEEDRGQRDEKTEAIEHDNNIMKRERKEKKKEEEIKRMTTPETRQEIERERTRKNESRNIKQVKKGRKITRRNKIRQLATKIARERQEQ